MLNVQTGMLEQARAMVQDQRFAGQLGQLEKTGQ
jgi:hypothetical protein